MQEEEIHLKLSCVDVSSHPRLKGCSHGAIATANFLSQQMGCMGFNVSVHMVRLRQ